MLKQRKIRFLTIGMAIALLAAAMPLAALASETASFSGDDAYDRAAGGAPESAFASSDGLMKVAAASFSGDDLYDPAAGGDPEGALGSEKVVDAWNPSNPNLALLSAPMTEAARAGSQQEVANAWNPSNPSLALFSAEGIEVARAGDEQQLAEGWNSEELSVADADPRDYMYAGWDPIGEEIASSDPRDYMYAGWDPMSDAALASGVSNDEAALDCNSPGSSDSLAAAPGTYSGDDYYDPAAGGTPEQTVFAYAVAYGKLMACAPGDTVIQ